MNKKAEPDTRVRVPDSGRETAAITATARYRGRSYYVDRHDAEGRLVGQERSLVATIDSEGTTLPLSVSGRGVNAEFEIPAIVYDGNQSDIGAPLRLVLTAQEAGNLVDDLKAWLDAAGAKT